MKTKFVWLAVCVALLLTAVSPSCCAVFYDIDGHPARDDIERAVTQGWLPAVNDNMFAPEDKLTRAMLVSALWCCSGEPTENTEFSFSDVASDSWYAPAVQWAIQHGITSGTSETTFSPDQPVTREQLAVMLIGYVNDRNRILPRVRRGIQFSDASDCSDRALDALHTLYRAGILDLTQTGAMEPHTLVTRAQGATILCRCADACTCQCTVRQQAAIISHSGYTFVAPENTLPAYVLSDEKGYAYVETDVRFTRDNIPVLLHDASIDRTSSGSGRIADLTYRQAAAFDFNAGKSKFSPISLPTFRQFIQLCAQRHLHPYIELKSSVSGRQIDQLFDIVKEYHMSTHVSWISFDYPNLKRICRMYPSAELGYLCIETDRKAVQATKKLKTEQNSVYLCAKHTHLTAEIRAQCLRAGIYLEVWTMNDKATAVRQLNTSAQGITVDRLTINDLYG